jgi:hypothetical protein
VSERGSHDTYPQVILFGLVCSWQCMALTDLPSSTIILTLDTLQHEKFLAH